MLLLMKLYCRALFESYCEVHVDPDITNTMDLRTKWAICLGPTGNLQGSSRFLSLATAKKVTWRKFMEMPTTKSVIEQVKKMAVKDGMTKGLSFRNKKGVEYKFHNRRACTFSKHPCQRTQNADGAG